MISSQTVEKELLSQRPQDEDGTSLSQRDIDLSQRSDNVILIEEGVIKKELDTEDLSTDCSLLTERLPDVISQQQMNHVDCLRMRNSLTEILEEVKLRRVGISFSVEKLNGWLEFHLLWRNCMNNDLENEERIRHLVQEKYEMERKLDGEKCHFASLSEEHDKKIAEIKRQFEDKIKVLQAEVKEADLRKRHLATGNTVLNLAASIGRKDVLEFLLNFCKPKCGVDVRRLSGSSRRRLSINALNGSDKTALQLVPEKGFDHNLRDHHGNTPLIVGCKVGNVDVVLFLLQSAVYPQSFAEDDNLLENNLDNHFEVLDTASLRTHSQEGEPHCTYHPIVNNSSIMRFKPSSKSRSSSVTNASIYTQPFHSEAQSTINLEKVHSRFEVIKLNLHKHSHQEQAS
ncbi:unnamed protein product [Mytilus coruscus]|uniref:Uncharacterized protein n=1 Tax=Mytilus coruscus TaxID=42192 RepID=A0A6J8B756_MYTCO|nr:unnamed protein product [Mytilus coruscus]